MLWSFLRAVQSANAAIVSSWKRLRSTESWPELAPSSKQALNCAERDALVLSGEGGKGSAAVAVSGEDLKFLPARGQAVLDAGASMAHRRHMHPRQRDA